MPPQSEEQLLREVKSADPFTVIENAKHDLQNGVEDSPWLTEQLSRFEMQCKAIYGSAVPAAGTSSSRS